MKADLRYTTIIKEIYGNSWRNGKLYFIASIMLLPVYLILITIFKAVGFMENLK